MDVVTDDDAEANRRILDKHGDDIPRAIRLVLGLNAIRVALDVPSDFSIESVEVFPGPFELGEAAV